MSEKWGQLPIEGDAAGKSVILSSSLVGSQHTMYQMAAWERRVDHVGRMESSRAFLKSIYSFAYSHWTAKVW